MMQLSLIKRWLFLLAITRIEGSGALWKSRHSLVNEKISKTILDSCYENDSLLNPTVIWGNFGQSIGNLAGIRLNRIPGTAKNYWKKGVESYRDEASKFIIMADSPEKLASDLTLLSGSKWWNHMASFLIVEKNEKTCGNVTAMLMATWKLNILNSVYICTEAMNASALYTFNPMANYAPSPWTRMEEFEDLNVFRQIFDSNNPCGHLHYDKTKFLNGYKIKVVYNVGRDALSSTELYDFVTRDLEHLAPVKTLQNAITAVNATGTLEFSRDARALLSRLIYGTADINIENISGIPKMRKYLILHPSWSEIIGVVKLGSEISTLTKIRELWSTPVLLLAAVALGILFIVLMIMNHSFSVAILDITRLLVYTSISTDNRSHKFRIYFTTMLIFMVISNGVFQSSIAAFLTTRERAQTVETVQELAELGYKIHVLGRGDANVMKGLCPKCHITITKFEPCVKLLLEQKGRHACIVPKELYESFWILHPLDSIKKSVSSGFSFFLCRRDWPLQHRIRDVIITFFESGLIGFWEESFTRHPKNLRQAMEADWSSTEYRPVKLYKLKFAFQTLALGLSISTIVFFFELVVAKWNLRNGAWLSKTPRPLMKCWKIK